MWPMVPTLTCGLLRSNFSLAMSSTPSSLSNVHPRAPRYGGQPSLSDGLPTVHRRRASVDNLRQPVGSPTVARSILRDGQIGADVQDRTGDLVLTKDALCQLSYIGNLGP